jgi:hypothetical protein
MKEQRTTEGDNPEVDPSAGVAESAEADSGEPEKQGSKTKDDHPEAEEVGGPQGPEPTRYGDWERKGRCIDF